MCNTVLKKRKETKALFRASMDGDALQMNNLLNTKGIQIIVARKWQL